MFDFNKFQPIELDDLIRLGGKYDGGYILAKRQIEKTKTILSFGVQLDWAFEKAFFKRKNVKIYAYDLSTKELLEKSAWYWIRFSLRSCAGVVYNLARLNPYRAKEHLWQICLKSKFYRFFNSKKERHFIPKYLGTRDDDTHTSLGTVFKELGNVDDTSIFLKMDIEGAEYDTLPQLVKHLDKINGIAIEVHFLATRGGEFIKLLDMLLEKFYIAHVHGNNYCGLVENTEIPNIIEVTLINKNLITGSVAPSREKYPIKGLDSPCNRYKQDYVLPFTQTGSCGA
ncbi:MAG: FkbM family methyltransferase [Chitinispirillales bacterium]|jgi:hypothetical protein|nr:FkbM family methyltransferase [Chitinispirillales bacterium]